MMRAVITESEIVIRIMLLFLIVLSSSAKAETPANPSWHHLGKISLVTVMGDGFYVRGTNPSGHACINAANFYGTVSLKKGRPGFSEQYSMALAGYMAGKSMSCLITSVRSDGICEMTNCYLK